MHTSNTTKKERDLQLTSVTSANTKTNPPFLQHDRKDLKLRFHLNIIHSIPTEDPFWACAINILHIMVFKTKLEQLKTTVSLENIAGNISYQCDTEINLFFCANTILQCNFFVLLYYLLTEITKRHDYFSIKSQCFSVFISPFLTSTYLYIYT